jgi:hypothetical protein
MTVLRVCYKLGVLFDERYYFDHHIPMAGPIMGALSVFSAAFAFSAVFSSRPTIVGL